MPLNLDLPCLAAPSVNRRAYNLAVGFFKGFDEHAQHACEFCGLTLVQTFYERLEHRLIAHHIRVQQNERAQMVHARSVHVAQGLDVDLDH
jgi:hypothetical protein